MFRRTMQTIDRIIERTSYVGVYIAGIMVLIQAFLATYGVIRRYIFHNPEPYSYELSTIFLVIGIVLALPYIQRVGRHLRVDILSNRFPEWAQTFLLDILTPLLALFYLGIMTWQSWLNAWYSLKIGERTFSVWAPPYFPLKIWVPIGVGLLCIVLLGNLSRGIYFFKEKIAKMR